MAFKKRTSPIGGKRVEDRITGKLDSRYWEKDPEPEPAKEPETKQPE